MPIPNKHNKYIYGWKLYVDYGQGWEWETFECTYRNYRENKKHYELNCRHPQKWVKGRMLNDTPIEDLTMVRKQL